MGTKKIIYPQHEQAIYLWRLNEDGSLSKYVINEYREMQFSLMGFTQYMFKIENEPTPRCIRDVQLDRFLNKRVCSFDSDDKKVRRIIDDTLSAKANKYKEDYEATVGLLKAFRGQT